MGKKKKKAAARETSRKTASRKRTASKKSAVQRSVRGKKNKGSAAVRPTAPKASGKKASAKKASSKKAASPIRLGRPKVTGDEKLFMLFHDDYHARQIFEFLRVETVKELEAYSPDEIVRLLSQPIQDTVRRIRERLASKNRRLAGDEQFAAQYKAQ